MIKKQMALPEERETHINIDYFERKIYVDTNVATVMNRLERKGFKVDYEGKIDGQVFNRQYVLDFKDMSKVAKVGLFSCGRDGEEEELEGAE